MSELTAEVEAHQLRLQIARLQDHLREIACYWPEIVNAELLAETPSQAAKEVLGPVVELLERCHIACTCTTYEMTFKHNPQCCDKMLAKQQIERLKGLM